MSFSGSRILVVGGARRVGEDGLDVLDHADQGRPPVSVRVLGVEGLDGGEGGPVRRDHVVQHIRDGEGAQGSRAHAG